MQDNDVFKQLETLSAKAQNYRYQGTSQRLVELAAIIKKAQEKELDLLSK